MLEMYGRGEGIWSKPSWWRLLLGALFSWQVAFGRGCWALILFPC